MFTIGDDKGVILVWNFMDKICNVWTPLQSSVTCSVLSPHDADVAVFGYVDIYSFVCLLLLLSSGITPIKSNVNRIGISVPYYNKNL